MTVTPEVNLCLGILAENVRRVEAWCKKRIPTVRMSCRAIEALLWIQGNTSERRISFRVICDGMGWEADYRRQQLLDQLSNKHVTRFVALQEVADEYLRHLARRHREAIQQARASA